jgi:hypothetical protein
MDYASMFQMIIILELICLLQNHVQIKRILCAAQRSLLLRELAPDTRLEGSSCQGVELWSLGIRDSDLGALSFLLVTVHSSRAVGPVSSVAAQNWGQ